MKTQFVMTVPGYIPRIEKLLCADEYFCLLNKNNEFEEKISKKLEDIKDITRGIACIVKLVAD